MAMFCPDCDRSLDDVPYGEPCPSCGGSRRSANAVAVTAHARAIVGEAGIRVTKGDHRPWSEKWRKTLRCLDELQAAYANARGLGNDEVDRRVEAFFGECNDMAHWLQGDLVNLRGVTREEIGSYRGETDALRRCSDFCNSHKHHTRDKSSGTARIRETEIPPSGGARITIEFEWATCHAKHVDALDLAEECVTAWRAFFAKKGIKEQ